MKKKRLICVHVKFLLKVIRLDDFSVVSRNCIKTANCLTGLGILQYPPVRRLHPHHAVPQKYLLFDLHVIGCGNVSKVYFHFKQDTRQAVVAI